MKHLVLLSLLSVLLVGCGGDGEPGEEINRGSDQNLTEAVSSNDVGRVKDALKRNPIKEGEGRPYLDEAIVNNNAEIVRVLLEAGVKADYVDETNGQTYLHIAVHQRNVEMAKALVEVGGVNPNHENIDEHAPLDVAQAYKEKKEGDQEQVNAMIKYLDSVTNEGVFRYLASPCRWYMPTSEDNPEICKEEPETEEKEYKDTPHEPGQQ